MTTFQQNLDESIFRSRVEKGPVGVVARGIGVMIYFLVIASKEITYGSIWSNRMLIGTLEFILTLRSADP